jgi:ribulose-phosphate 3-epimerase
MSIICPTVTAFDTHEYRSQVERIVSFAPRIHIDLMDGEFAPTKSPELSQIWLPENVECDVHIMYKRPQDYIEQLVALNPRMVIVQAESDCDIPKFAAAMRSEGIKTGISVLQNTKISDVTYLFPHIQHVLVFSGDLGHFGGQVDMTLTSKAVEVKTANKHLEIGWDGGVNIENCRKLADAGIDVLNVGGAIQKSATPQEAYATMVSKIDTHA